MHHSTQQHLGIVVTKLQYIISMCASGLWRPFSPAQYPCTSVFSLLFLSLPYLWSRLPPLPPLVPLFLTDLPLFWPSVVFHRRRTEHLSALALLLPSFIVVCVGKHACVCMCTLLIHSISGIPCRCCSLIAHHRPLKDRSVNRFLPDGLLLKYFEDVLPQSI